MSSAPIRQPRGPPSSASTFTAPAPVSTGPPPPDAESLLRRNKTLATPRSGAGSGSGSGAGGGMHGSGGMMDNGTGAGTGNGRAGGGGGGGAHAAHRRSFGGVAGGAHGPGSGASAAAAAAAMAADGYGQSRYRSGSFSGNVNVNVGHGGHPVGVVPPGMPMGGYMDTAGLIRRASQRDQFGRSGTEETLIETEAGDEHDAATERGTWGKGLARQSSLPSRRLANGGVNPGLFTQASNTDQSSGANNSGSMPPPPPRPPRRVYHPSVDSGSAASPPPATSTSHSHAPSQSLSSLSMINIPPPSSYEGGNAAGHSHSPVTPVSASQSSNSHGSGAAVGNVVGVSRTQSLRAHMNPHPPSSPVDVSTLGRSASMRAPGELHYSRMHASPPPVHHPFSAATPPRKGAALHNTFQYPPADDSDLIEPTDLKRHQSLTYGSSNRMRERLERSQALLSLDQREDLRRRLAASPAGSQSGSSRNRHSRHPSEINVDESPSNPIGRSVWTPGAPTPGDDGWSGSPAQLQDALDALSISRDGAGSGMGHQPAPTITTNHHPGEEPAWVTNLVGMPGQPSPQAPQRPLWDERSQPSPYLQGWNGQLQPPLGMFQQQQQQLYAAQAQLKLAAAGLGGHVPVMPPMHHLQHGYPLGQGYLGAPFSPTYATPPGSAVPHLPGMPSPGVGPGVGGAPLSAQDIDVIELARSKGLNPATFDCRPPVARFFVIKSYTEDDVQKSLKHEIWSSTVLGNKRLDTAFRESSDKGPIYLFFSVNGSRHFCGVATMLTPVDETQSSTVWAQDKWKGIFKVRWIFVRDVPTTALRHIRLTNTPERKPITNSRDTQELPYEAGCEVLQIFLDHQHKSKTSLLQDFAYYERLSASRAASTGGPSGATSPVPSGHMTPQPQAQQPLAQQQGQAYRV